MAQQGDEWQLDPQAIALISMSHNMSYSSYDVLIRRAKPIIDEYCEMLTKSWSSASLPFSDSETLGKISLILQSPASKPSEDHANEKNTAKHTERQPWSADEQQLLEELITQRDKLSWKQVSDELLARLGVRRTPNNCEQRWNRVQNPQIHKGRWTSEEDAILIRIMQTSGDLKLAQENLSGRTVVQCRRRWSILSGGE